MKVSDVIEKIKNRTHDISEEYSESEYIAYINTAIQQISSLLISLKYPLLVKQTTVMDGDTIPTNYMRLAGKCPIRMTNGQIEIQGDYDNVTVRYFYTPEALELSTEDLPFNNRAINEAIITVATLLAKNDNEYDLTQDSALFTALETAIAQGMS